MNLLTVYEHMLKCGGMVSDQEGYISSNLSGKLTPAQIKVTNSEEVKRLVLPTPNQLEGGDWSVRVAFNPLKENVLNGESQVVRYLREKINYKLNMTIKSLLLSTVEYAYSNHEGKIASKRLELLNTVDGADEKMHKTFSTLMEKVPVTNLQNSFVNMYLKKLGKLGTKSYPCMAVVSFPLYKHLIDAKESRELFGVKLRHVDYNALKAFLEYLFKDIDDLEKYKFGIDSSVAPFTEALLAATDQLGKQLNKVTDLLFKTATLYNKEESTTLHEFFYYDDAHMEALKDIDPILAELRLIPQLPGNEDAVAKEVSASVDTQIAKTTHTISEEDASTMSVKESTNKFKSLTETLTTAQPQAQFNQPTTMQTIYNQQQQQQVPQNEENLSLAARMFNNRIRQQQQYMQQTGMIPPGGIPVNPYFTNQYQSQFGMNVNPYQQPQPQGVVRASDVARANQFGQWVHPQMNRSNTI